MRLIKLNKATELPAEWDVVVGDNVYLKREFLAFIERTESDYFPTYHLFYDDDGVLDSVFLSHPKKHYNMTMFTKINYRVSVTFIYLPMCVTSNCIVMGKLKKAVLDEIKAIKGYKMILNLDDDDMPGFATGLTCPKCILDINFTSLEDYFSSMRSDYRNRAKKVMAKSKPLKIAFIDNKTQFSDELYNQYLNVLNNSRMRIETLSKEYFEGDMFKVFVASLDGKPVGFVQLLENGDELIFEFVGVDYNYNEAFAVYHRMLYEIIRYGIDNGFKTVDFGQTADDIKLKLGCRYVYLYAALHHSNRFVNFLCRKLGPKIQYKPVTTTYRVFKGEEK